MPTWISGVGCLIQIVILVLLIMYYMGKLECQKFASWIATMHGMLYLLLCVALLTLKSTMPPQIQTAVPNPSAPPQIQTNVPDPSRVKEINKWST